MHKLEGFTTPGRDPRRRSAQTVKPPRSERSRLPELGGIPLAELSRIPLPELSGIRLPEPGGIPLPELTGNSYPEL